MILLCNCISDDKIKELQIQHAQKSSYDDTATTSSEFDARGDIPSPGKRCLTSPSSVDSFNSSKASKHSVSSSFGFSTGNSKINLDEEYVAETIASAVTAEEVDEQDFSGERIVKDVADNFNADLGSGIVLNAYEVINEEEETEVKPEATWKKQEGKKGIPISL
jgi:hypothetical protein